MKPGWVDPRSRPPPTQWQLLKDFYQRIQRTPLLEETYTLQGGKTWVCRLQLKGGVAENKGGYRLPAAILEGICQLQLNARPEGHQLSAAILEGKSPSKADAMEAASMLAWKCLLDHGFTEAAAEAAEAAAVGALQLQQLQHERQQQRAAAKKKKTQCNNKSSMPPPLTCFRCGRKGHIASVYVAV